MAEEGEILTSWANQTIHVGNDAGAWVQLVGPGTPGANPWSTNPAGIHYTAGNVGVGTPAPAELLDVHGSGMFRRPGVAEQGIQFTADIGANWIRGRSLSPSPKSLIFDQINAGASSYYSFRFDGASKVAIRQTGRVDIGGPQSYAGLLNIGGVTTSQGLISSGHWRIRDYDDGAGVARGFLTYMRDEIWQINKETAATLEPVIRLRGSTVQISSRDNSNSYFNNPGTRLGVGTATPQEKLHVEGSAYVTGDVSCDSVTILPSGAGTAPWVFASVGGEFLLTSAGGGGTPFRVTDAGYFIINDGFTAGNQQDSAVKIELPTGAPTIAFYGPSSINPWRIKHQTDGDLSFYRQQQMQETVLKENGDIHVSGDLIRSDETWHTPSLLNGWAGPARYRKYPDRRVEVQLNIRYGADRPSLVLPAGYRPDQDVFFGQNKLKVSPTGEISSDLGVLIQYTLSFYADA